eukprot:scaffold79190_cov20-Tisochrysis_lutea.AAC.2
MHANEDMNHSPARHRYIGILGRPTWRCSSNADILQTCLVCEHTPITCSGCRDQSIAFKLLLSAAAVQGQWLCLPPTDGHVHILFSR